MTKIVHCRKEKYDVYIGRPGYYGNPYILEKEEDRDKVLDQYKAYFEEKMKNDPLFKLKILQLKGKILGCWCSPRRCHGDIIANFLNNLKEN